MKVAFPEQAVSEAEKQKQQINKSKAAYNGAAAAAGQVPFAAMVNGIQDVPGMGGEKGKSLIELQQEAGSVDAAVAQDYMTVMSHTLSAEDYAKMQEEGFDLGSMEPEDVVTIVDKIKAELVRSGQNIAGYTDDMDMETLTAALGSQVLAQAVADSFQAADVPLSKENLSAVSQAWEMNNQLQPMSDGSRSYLIDNDLETEIWSLYLAQNSGAGKGGGAPKFYAEDVHGYYTQSAGGRPSKQNEELLAQIDKIIEQSGREVNEDSHRDASWLLDRGLPLTTQKMNKLADLQNLELPVKEEHFAQAAAAAVAEGKTPLHADVTKRSENLYEKAAEISDYYHSKEFWEANVGDITARRQMEEIRLRMTAEVNVKLLKRGFAIDTAPMEELIEALKMAESQVANRYFPKDAEAVEKYRNYHQTNSVAADLPKLPVDVLGPFAQGHNQASLAEFHRSGKAMQEVYEKAQKSYETLMTSPRSDLGDSIQKAFGNTDSLLKGIGAEITDENRRAIRILGYNQMEITTENLEAVKEADRLVQDVIQKLTPAATLKMIRDGINPLEKSFGELEEYFEKLPPEYKKESESYSRFLYGLERNAEITPEERESYIGIYRLVRQLERADGAAVGALVNAQAELQFSNLLSAVRNGRLKAVDVKVTEELGSAAEKMQKAKNNDSISAQIAKAFVKTANKVVSKVSSNAKAVEEYNKTQLENIRRAVATADKECVAMLERGEMSASADNLMAAQALAQGSENIFEQGDRRRNAAGRKQPAEPAKNAPTQNQPPQKAAEASEPKSAALVQSGPRREITNSNELWEILDDSEHFTETYVDFAQKALEAVEDATFTEAESSLDVRSMQLNHKQLTVAASLAKQEEFFIPLQVGGTVTQVHLTLDRNSAQKGTVTVGVAPTEEDYMQARLYVENGAVYGIFMGGAQNEVMKMQEIADTFKREASASWTVGNITVVPAGGGMPEFIRPEEHVPTENAELYRVAKVFLQAVMETTAR